MLAHPTPDGPGWWRVPGVFPCVSKEQKALSPVRKTFNQHKLKSLLLAGFSALLWLFLWSGSANAAKPAEVVRIRFFSGPEKTRIVLDLDGPCSYEIRKISNPDRLVINLPLCSFASSSSIAVDDGLVRRIRRNPGKTRAQVVLDLFDDVQFSTFSLPPEKERPHRVVLDVLRPKPDSREKAVLPVVSKLEAPEESPFTVIIDPGHGGLDPGAIRGSIQEKNVVLEVSLELARLLNSLPGYRAILTRDADYYPSLARRVEIAGEKNGDLFISVHCNTHKKKSIGGVEVYFLSLQGATDREARELADKENAADLVGLASEDSYDDLVLSILMDMRMTMVLHESARLSKSLLVAADASAVVKKRKAKQAGFQVLKSLAMPSALVEIAYLSNAEDKAVLCSSEGRDQLAVMLAEGIVSWRHDEEGLALLNSDRPHAWGQEYAVRRGDSLWNLAHRFGTTIQEITNRNQLQSRALVVGQVLHLPRGVEEP